MNTDIRIAAVILAGGRSRRMGGSDKGAIMHDNKPLIEYAINAITPQLDNIVISANRNIDFYKQYNFPVLADDIGEYWGPLAGMLTAMKFCKCDLLLTVPCDVPQLPEDLLQHMLETMQQRNCDVVLAKDRERLHPVISLLKCELQDKLKNYLQQGERKVLKWMQCQNWAAADFSNETDRFANINSEADIK